VAAVADRLLLQQSAENLLAWRPEAEQQALASTKPQDANGTQVGPLASLQPALVKQVRFAENLPSMAIHPLQRATSTA
jgi:hypothetical protein